MQSVNSSNFTYAEPPIRATNISNPYSSLSPGSVAQSKMVETSANYSTLRTINQQPPPQISYTSVQPRVITNQVV
jgi:hypothetical protein